MYFTFLTDFGFNYYLIHVNEVVTEQHLIHEACRCATLTNLCYRFPLIF